MQLVCNVRVSSISYVNSPVAHWCIMHTQVHTSYSNDARHDIAACCDACTTHAMLLLTLVEMCTYTTRCDARCCSSSAAA